MIALHGIDKIYQTPHSMVHALKNISLEVAAGETVGVLGRPAAGKSSLLRCVNLLEKPTRGTVIIDHCPLSSLANKPLRLARRSMGMITEDFNLLDSRTVYDNIALPLELCGTPPQEIEKIIHPLLVLIGLTDKASAYPKQLSGGQKQRVAIARALALRPKILLCDDPTASLDAKSAQSILQLLRDVHEHYQLTILLATQEIEVIKAICDRVAVLHQGTIVEQNSVIDLFAHPQTDLSKELVRTATRLELPTAFRRRLRPQPSEDSNPVLRISLVGVAAQEPLIAQVIQDYQLMINIMQAHLETIRSSTLGIMIVEIMGNRNNIQKAKDFLESKGLYIEVLGYAPRSA